MIYLLFAITIYIGPNLPIDRIVWACEQWFSKVEVVPESEACIRFYYVPDLYAKGVTNRPNYTTFPYIPPKGTVRVRLREPSKVVLLHELGHCVGLAHRPNSIMSSSPRNLTRLDYESIKIIKSLE